MATEKVYLYAGTYVERANPSTNYAGSTALKTNMVPATKISTYETIANDITKSANINDAALLQFLIPGTLKYKKITSVTLSYYLSWDGGSGHRSPSYADIYKMYQYSGNLNAVTWGNMSTVGVMAAGKYDMVTTYSETSGSEWVTTDLTSIYADGLVAGNSGSIMNVFVLASESILGYLTIQGGSSGNIPYLNINYETVDQLPPTPSYPNGITLKEGQSVLFSWIHNSETEAVQASYQLEYKKASASSWTTVTGTTAHSYTLTNGLTAGDYVWRVKITNDAGETSAYSSTASFAVVGRPSMPVIGEPSNKCLTTITWNSADQNSAELTLTDTKGNVIVKELIANASTSYKVNEFLKGTYTVGVRVKNSIDLWSDWAYKTFVIDAEGPDAPTLEVTPLGTSVFCEVRDIPDGASVAIMRAVDGETNYKCIGLLDTDIKLFSDNTVCSGVTYRYVARAYTDGYTDSYARTVSVLFDGMVLNSDNFELHLTESNDKYLVISEDISCESSVMHFSGREFPIVEKSEFTTWRLDRKFFVTPEQRQELEGFLRLTQARYRDSRGRSFPCALLSVKYSEFMDEGYIATLSLIRTAEDEVIINV